MFENEEDTPRWKAGKSVAYCETCLNETMKGAGRVKAKMSHFGHHLTCAFSSRCLQ